MARAIELQPWTVLRGAKSEYELVQEVQDWVDASAHSIATLTIEAPELTACKLKVEGCDDGGGYFTGIMDIQSTTSSPVVKNLIRAMPMGSTEHLYNHLRWHIIPSANDWSVTFRVTAILK